MNLVPSSLKSGGHIISDDVSTMLWRIWCWAKTGPSRACGARDGLLTNCRDVEATHQSMSCLVVGHQVIVPKNLEHRPNELSLIVVTDVVVPHWLSSPIRT